MLKTSARQAGPSTRRPSRRRAPTAAPRTAVTASAYVQRLASLLGPQAPLREAREAFAQGLGAWTGWTDAIALSAALDAPLDPAAPEPQVDRQDAAVAAGSTDAPAGGDRADADATRARLLARIDGDVAAAGYSPLGVDLGYGPFRQCQLGCQQAMAQAVAALRERVRQRLWRSRPALARLVSLDLALEQVIGAPERRLLGAVPQWLEAHYVRLRANADGPDEAMAAFRRDLREVLVAELALRFEPVEGLLAALAPACDDVATRSPIDIAPPHVEIL